MAIRAHGLPLDPLLPAFATRVAILRPGTAGGAIQAPLALTTGLAPRRALRRQESFASSASEPAGAARFRLLPCAFPAGAADSRPRHGRHRATEFGKRLFA